MSNKYKNTFKRITYLSAAVLLGIAVFSTFHVRQTHADSIEPGTASVAPAFVDAFNPVIGGSNGQIVDSFIQADGKTIVTGEFKVMNGVNRNSIARFNTDGTLDMTFNTGAGPNDAVFSIAQQADGKLLIAGLFTAYNGVSVGRVARLNLDGTIDQTFNTTGLAMNPQAGANNQIGEVKVLPDGKIMVGGIFTTFNGTPQNRLARLHSDGTLDTGFTVGNGPSNEVTVITPLADGKIMIGGNFVQYNSVFSPRLARINPDGSLDSSFQVASGADQIIMAITEQPDGKVIASGFMTTFGGIPANGIARVNTNGSVDQTFNVLGIDAVVIAHALQPDGKVILGGSFTTIAGATRQCITRVNPDGSTDATFNPGAGIGSQVVNDITLQADGRAIVNGTFSVYNGTANGGAVRINPDGTLDTNLALKSSTVGNVTALAVQPDNKVLVGGSFTMVGTTSRLNLARVNTDGTNDASFNPGTGPNLPVNAIAVQENGKIVVGGLFSAFNGSPSNRIVRLNSDGSIDTGFSVGAGLNSSLEAMLLMPDGKILVGGAFSQYNGAAASRFIRLNSDGSLDATFNNGTSANGTVRQITLLPDGKLLIAGAFTSYNGTTRNRIARLNADGSLDTSFDPAAGPNNTINSFAVHPDGKVVIGGTFTSVAGTARAKLAQLNADGSLDTGFDISGTGPGPGTGNNVTRVLSVEGGKTIVAGNFTTFNGQAKHRVIRVNANGKVDPTFLGGLGAHAPVGLTIGSMIRQPDGMILIGGQFSVFNVSPRTGIARFKNATDTYGDFDGDGKTDFSVLRRPGPSGQYTWWINNSGNDVTSAIDFGLSPADVPQPGDFDGDGRDDIAIWRNSPQSGQVSSYYIIQSSTNTIRVIPFGQSGDVPVTEDYDGDGKDDLSVWRAPASGSTGQATWYYLGSQNNPNNNVTFIPFGMRYGTQTDQVDEPYPGDFDGDGRADFRVQRRVDINDPSLSTAGVFHTMTAAGAISHDYFGWAGDRILPGDYDGDGRTDLAVGRGFNFSGGTITWYIRYANGSQDTAVNWGAGVIDLFAQGDYDGDGITDLAVYRRAGEYNFYVRRSSDSTMQVYHLGDSNNSIPVVNYNNR